jgi:hypothetical protein
MHVVSFPAALMALALAAFPASANDSQAELAIGGIALTQSDAITLDSEDLFIARDEIRVSYRFTNTSSRNITTLVAFPLPDLPTGDGFESGAAPGGDWRTALKFETRVEGQPIDLIYEEKALFRDADISARLTALGVPLYYGAENFDKAINDLAEADRRALIAEELIVEAGSAGYPLWSPKWILRATVVREQEFPAGTTISVEHRYRPINGGSVGGTLEPQYRREPASKEYLDARLAKYCIEDDWLKSFDRKGAQISGKPDGPFPHGEIWIGYVLKSGANWKGPIKDFRLVVDKGKPDSLVSFCASGVKKIGPTQFEVRYRDFEPRDDINILIVDWAPTQ